MNKMYKIRVILDTEEDVIRTLLVDHTINLESLHLTIANAFGFDGTEMASFYLSDTEWNQGQEIPLFDMSESGDAITMSTTLLEAAMEFVESKMIYVYDFLNMWTFYVEVLEIDKENNKDLPKTILSVGEIPEQAPDKEFTTEDMLSDFDDEFKDEFESLDDFDFDNY